jgi:hypothetical protein
VDYKKKKSNKKRKGNSNSVYNNLLKSKSKGRAFHQLFVRYWAVVPG